MPCLILRAFILNLDESEILLDPLEPEANVIVLMEEELNVMDLTVHRSNLVKDMILAFSDPKILNASVFFKVIDAHGNVEQGEGRGVGREVITEFWHLFY